jgi:uncharacterized protein with beta-barrel porin domain
MNKSLICCALLVGAGLPATAQIINPSFETGDFTGWATAGDPAVVSTPPFAPATIPNGTYTALINSTANPGFGIYATGESTTAAALNTFLQNAYNPTFALPANSYGVATNGEAIQQSFTLAHTERLTFSWKYDSRELLMNDTDSTGYVLNGVYHQLANANTPGQSMANGVGFLYSGLPWETLTLNLPAGTDTLAFVAYNTGDINSPSGIFIDNLTLAMTTSFASTPGLDPNQLATAHYIDAHSANPTPALTRIITILEGAPTPAILAQDLNALSPESLGIFRNIAFDNATFFTEDVTNHLANLRDGLTGFDTSGLNVNGPAQSPQESQIKRHLGDPKELRDPKEMSDSKEMAPVEPSTNAAAHRWSVWVAGDVVLADLSHNQDIEHENYTTGSVMLGADYRLGAHFTVGVLVGYGHTDSKLDNEGGKATADTYYPGLYASYVDGGWYANGLAAYNYNSYTEDRHVNLPGLNGFDHGAFQGNEYLADLNGGYEFQSGSWKYGPFAGLQYVHLDLDPFTEDGPTSLNIQRQDDDSLRSQLGLQARYVTFVGDVALVPHASVAWQHEYLANDRGITSAFTGAGGGSFTVQTEDTGNDSAFIDLGLDATLCQNVTLFLDYQTDAGASHFFAQSVLAGVSLGF